jgi:hypothetical protein
MPRTTFRLPKLFSGYFVKKLAQKFRQDVNINVKDPFHYVTPIRIYMTFIREETNVKNM